MPKIQVKIKIKKRLPESPGNGGISLTDFRIFLSVKRGHPSHIHPVFRRPNVQNHATRLEGEHL